MIRLKRIYDRSAADDGFRVLVERLWPRGMIRERARIDLWVQDAGASTDLRKWFSHNPGKWEEFKRKYFDELSKKPEVVRMIVDLVREKPIITFLYTAHDKEHNSAVVLKMYLHSKGHGG
jgi:uncharacterized protein YeaO (DUF488 family)